jgi:hypothetical protein
VASQQKPPPVGERRKRARTFRQGFLLETSTIVVTLEHRFRFLVAPAKNILMFPRRNETFDLITLVVLANVTSHASMMPTA